MSPTRRRGAACVLSLLALLSWPADSRALELQPDTRGLAPAEIARSRQLLDSGAARLPPRWRDALGVVTVQWRDDLPAGVHGRAFAGRIGLRRGLLRDTDDRAALAALVHELAHLYDRATGGALSRDPRLLDLAGWQDAPLRPWRTRNDFTGRSPDRYELTDPGEYVAVNLEHYLLDEDYGCRRPALFRWFNEAFDADPAPPGCPAELPFMEAGGDAGAPLLGLDPARVHAVDYLFAEGDDAAMSRWGHAMLRLVVCAPGRAPGPDCRLDLGEHLVLSFRAFVDDVQVSSWRGLTGSYPSRLFVLPLAQVVAEYTEVELRGLQSIPLRLSPAEIATLLQRAAQVHWSYDGRYGFIGNNCAVETARLLQVGVPRLAAMPLMSITPTGLLRRLRRAGLADAGTQDDRAEALRLGYYFEPADAHQQAIYAVARDALDLRWDTAEQWLALAPRQRAPFTGQADLRVSAALLLLEQLALRRLESRARDALKRRLPAPRRDAARDVLALEAMLTRPAALAEGLGYGLPQPGERALIAARSTALKARWQQERRDLLAVARTWLPGALASELGAIETNLDRLGDRLRVQEQALNAAEAR